MNDIVRFGIYYLHNGNSVFIDGNSLLIPSEAIIERFTVTVNNQLILNLPFNSAVIIDAYSTEYHSGFAAGRKAERKLIRKWLKRRDKPFLIGTKAHDA